jgi:hypothetical protein
MRKAVFIATFVSLLVLVLVASAGPYLEKG